MARRPRIKSPEQDTFQHLYNRVNGPKNWMPFLDDRARKIFFDLLANRVQVYHLNLASYSLMGNHFHLVAEVLKATQFDLPELKRRAALRWPRTQDQPKNQAQWDRFAERICDVSEFMKDLQSEITRQVNPLFKRRGPLWGGRFKNTILDPDAVLQCIHYVEYNAVAAGLVERPEQWRWSSAWARAHGQDSLLMPLTRLTRIADPKAAEEWFLSSRARYAARRVVKDELQRESWTWLQGRVVGSAQFVQGFIDSVKEPHRRPIECLFDGFSRLDRLRPPPAEPRAA